jgi:diaminopimelate epimerase
VGEIAFVKGHGTRNDFVLLSDPDGALELTGDLVARLCDRRAGVGADGVLRVVRSAADAQAAAMAGQATWFMDYRNADGSIAETCGNGLRVFGRYLVDAGFAAAGPQLVATRAGVVRIDVPPAGDVSVDMGEPRVLESSKATLAGMAYEGLHVSMGNPHLVCILDTPIGELDLSSAPDVDPLVYPHGANVEFVNVLDDERAAMRVYERGVGETPSCGSGACAVAAALAVRAGVSTGRWHLEVAGGRLQLTIGGDGHVVLAGPAVLVAEGRYRFD